MRACVCVLDAVSQGVPRPRYPIFGGSHFFRDDEVVPFLLLCAALLEGWAAPVVTASSIWLSPQSAYDTGIFALARSIDVS